MSKRMLRGMILGVIGSVMILSGSAAAEETALRAPATVTSGDGSLSIQLPAEDWKTTEDANHLLVLTDGNDIITVDRLSRTDTLPQQVLADDNYAAVYQALVSTRDVIFAVEGAAAEEKDLEKIMQSIGTVRIIRQDAAAQQTGETTAPSMGLRNIDAVYYVTADDLNVRSGCSVDDEIIGSLSKGEEVHVDGAVTKDGTDYGWYQISYKDKQAYVSAGYLTENKPVASAPSSSSPAAPASSTDTPSSDLVYCEYCGQWYEAGNVFRNHVCPNRDAAYAAQSSGDSSPNMVYCEYCGQWYEEGNEFRNHICPARDAANAADSDDYDDGDDNMVYCEYCGQWYEAGNEFRNHVCPERDAAYAEE